MTGHEIVVGVTGGIAAFKTAALVSQLVQSGAGVTVVMTRAAERFVGAATFAALTGRPVAREVSGGVEAAAGIRSERIRPEPAGGEFRPLEVAAGEARAAYEQLSRSSGRHRLHPPVEHIEPVCG